ncbi:hypothetical protein [Streptomyces sp. Je 1-332]|uniref:hypothetical protein n=1 Tax=Streptomyces sp. Je 1-332 TaxID=3231270 RepID=UPI0034594E71
MIPVRQTVPAHAPPDIVQTQRAWTHTYNALAQAPATGNTALRRRLIDLSRRLVQDVPRAQLADPPRRTRPGQAGMTRGDLPPEGYGPPSDAAEHTDP